MNKYRKQRYLEWVANSITFFSIMIISFGYPVLGFVVNFCGAFLWIYYGFMTNQISFVAYNILYGLVALFGIYNWGRI